VPDNDASAFEGRLAAAARRTGQVLDKLLAEPPLPGEVTRPARLLAAMRHASLAGGKRFRPFLVIECARLFGVAEERAAMAAAALECVHCYSLVHDDLPAMDDDDFRRGAPTVHKAFDEATAILAGDALLTLAFDALARDATHADPAVRIALVGLLARGAGLGGMAGGQMLDVLAESMAVDEAGVRRLQAMKTGALIAAACEMGAVLGGADGAQRATLREYGAALGLAFQIADDLIDVEASPEAAGKATGKDSWRGKATFVSLLGVDKARARLAEAVNECRRRLDAIGGDTSLLRQAARFAAERKR
jgi:farnesyl diphosphate synthase